MKQHKNRSLGGLIFGIIIVVFGILFVLEGAKSGVGPLAPIVAIIVGIIIIYIYIRDTYMLKAVEVKQNDHAKARAKEWSAEVSSNRMEFFNQLYAIAEANGGFEYMKIELRYDTGVDLVAKNGRTNYSYAQLGYSKPTAGIVENAKEFSRAHGLLYRVQTYTIASYSLYEQVSNAMGHTTSSGDGSTYIGSVSLFTPEYDERTRANTTNYKTI